MRSHFLLALTLFLLALLQIELYNSVVDKEGTEGAEEAKKAYRASSEDSDHGSEKAGGGKVSAALINKVPFLSILNKLG